MIQTKRDGRRKKERKFDREADIETGRERKCWREKLCERKTSKLNET